LLGQKNKNGPANPERVRGYTWLGLEETDKEGGPGEHNSLFRKVPARAGSRGRGVGVPTICSGERGLLGAAKRSGEYGKLTKKKRARDQTLHGCERGAPPNR